MEIVGEDAVAGVALVAGESDIQATVQAVMAETVDVAFDGAVLVTEGDKLFFVFVRGLGGVFLAALGQHDGGHVELEEFAVAGASEAFVGAEAGELVRPVTVEKPVGDGQEVVDFGSAVEHGVVLHEFMLVGGDEETVAEFDVGAGFAFLNPLGVGLEEGINFFGGGDRLATEEAALHEVEVFEEHGVKILERFPLGQTHGLVAEGEQAHADFGREFVAGGEILAHGGVEAGGFGGGRAAAAVDGLARAALEGFEPAAPVLRFAPAGEREAGGGVEFFNPVHALAAGVPEEVQVGGEMDVGLEDVGVDLEFKGRGGGAFVFFKDDAAGGGDAGVDLAEGGLVEEGDIITERLMREAAVVGAEWRGGHAEKLADEGVMIGEIFETIVVGIETVADDAEDEDLPEIEAGAAGGFFAGEDFGFEEREDFGLQRRVRPDPLQAGEDRGQLVAALERENDFFDRREAEFGLGGEELAHGIRECCGVNGAVLL